MNESTLLQSNRLKDVFEEENRFENEGVHLSFDLRSDDSVYHELKNTIEDKEVLAMQKVIDFLVTDLGVDRAHVGHNKSDISIDPSEMKKLAVNYRMNRIKQLEVLIEQLNTDRSPENKKRQEAVEFRLLYLKSQSDEKLLEECESYIENLFAINTEELIAEHALESLTFVADDEIRKKLANRLVVVKKVGAGTYGAAYLAINYRLNKLVVIKNGKSEDLSEEDAARFEKEIKLLSKFDHPNVLKIYSANISEQSHIIVTEFVERGDLNNHLSTQDIIPYFSEGENPGAVDIVQDIAQALLALEKNIYQDGVGDDDQEAKYQPIVHRDIKPHNIFITKNGHVKLGDFGLARNLTEKEALKINEDNAFREALKEINDQDEGWESAIPKIIEGQGKSVTASEAIVGTPLYMAPENIRDINNLSPASDIYSLGVVAWKLVTGRYPFDKNNIMNLMNSVVTDELPLDQLPDDLPLDFRYLLIDMLDKEPVNRPSAEIIISTMKEIKANSQL